MEFTLSKFKSTSVVRTPSNTTVQHPRDMDEDTFMEQVDRILPPSQPNWFGDKWATEQFEISDDDCITPVPIKKPPTFISISCQTDSVHIVDKGKDAEVVALEEPLTGTNLKRNLDTVPEVVDKKKKAKVNKSDGLIRYCVVNEITDMTAFDRQSMTEILPFVTMPSLESLLPRAFSIVGVQLLKAPFRPLQGLDICDLQRRTGYECRIMDFLVNFHGWSLKQAVYFGYVLYHVLNWNEDKKYLQRRIASGFLQEVTHESQL